MDTIFTIVCLVLISALIISFMITYVGQMERVVPLSATEILTNWAAANSFQLLQFESLILFTGPYFMRHTKGQQVYYVTIVDQSNVQRSAYVLLGSPFLGLFSDQVDVTWDSDQRKRR